ncbi:putative ABC-type sugar transport system permease subunit [Bradyrhizobium sp. USDA 336]
MQVPRLMLNATIAPSRVSSFWQTVIKGLVIVAAVVVDQAQYRFQQRVASLQLARTV